MNLVQSFGFDKMNLLALAFCLFLHVSDSAAPEADCPMQTLFSAVQLHQKELKEAGPA